MSVCLGIAHLDVVNSFRRRVHGSKINNVL